ncbi:MAG: SCP2 sterol-binding domain-containing protein [Gammaproteobacteria bacterium]|nr:SCP2 sterol-binding domain-containing protein [Gammaproteobacteria bacterium]
MHKSKQIIGAALLFGIAGTSAAAPVLMSPADWGPPACEAWNQSESLTTGLVPDWIGNDRGRGYKVLHIYRSDCENSPQVELVIELKDGKAICTYGGATQKEPDTGVDYIMHADTKRWREMGAGKYGPMKAMMFGRLKFSGPMMEAMGHMGPFGDFLKLTGAVESDSSSCPQ